MGKLKICPNCLYMFQDSDMHDGKCFCRKCGGSFGYENYETADEINEGYRLLSNLNFEDADDIAEKLIEKNSENADAWFLRALAVNHVCYCDNDNKDLWPYDKIPTLNDVKFENICESEYAVKALKLAQTEGQRKSFSDVFEYLEKVRVKAAAVIKSGEYDCDVFISVKVSQIDENTKRPVTDADGNVLKTTDYEYARDIYDDITKKYPGCRVFLSEKMKADLVGKEYEPIIFAALRSAKVMILVGNSNFNIEWPWVRNEWKRYLYWKDNLNDGKKRDFLFVTQNPNVSMPQAFRSLQAIKATDLKASEYLFSFLDDKLLKTESKKIEGKTFGDQVAQTVNAAAVSEIGKKTLRKYAESRNTAVDKQISSCIYDLKDAEKITDATERKYKRKSCFNELRAIYSAHPEAHRAELYLLLENSDSIDFGKLFFDKTASEEIKKKFFEVADEKEALEVINGVVSYLSGEEGLYCDIAAAEAAFSSAIAPHFDYIDKDRLTDLSETMASKIRIELSDIRTNKSGDAAAEKKLNAVLKYARCRLNLLQYINNNDPHEYILDRVNVIESFKNIAINDSLAREIEKLCGEIEKVQKGNVYALWYGVATKIFSAVTTPGFLLEEIGSDISDKQGVSLFVKELKSKTNVIIHQKQIIDAFKNLFLYAPSESKARYDKKAFLCIFLNLLVSDESSYKKTAGGTIEQSKGKNDEDLNGYDLFCKYIEYDLGDESLYKQPYVFEGNGYSALNPNKNVWWYKLGKHNFVDYFLATFAVSLQNHGLFDSAVSIYKMYLGQQQSELGVDCILVRFYILLCQNNCKNVQEQIVSPTKIGVRELKSDIIELIENGNSEDAKELQKLRSGISDFADRQDAFADAAKQMGGWFDSLPELNIFNIEAYKSMKQKINFELTQRSRASALDKQIADRLSVAYKNEIKKLDADLKTLESVNDAVKTVFCPGLLPNSDFNEKKAWEQLCIKEQKWMGTKHYPFEKEEEQVKYLKNNLKYLAVNESKLDKKLDYLQNQFEKTKNESSRLIEKDKRSRERSESRRKFGSGLGVFFKYFFLLVPKIGAVIASVHLWGSVRCDHANEIFQAGNIWCFYVYLACAIVDLIEILAYKDDFDSEGIAKFQCISALIIHGTILIFCVFGGLSLACSGCHCGEGVTALLAGLPPVAVVAAAIYVIQDDF